MGIISEAIASIKVKLGDQKVEGSIKFDVEGEGCIVIVDGQVKESDEDTDCTLSANSEIFKDMFSGELNPTSAYMSGKLKIDGSMGVAMKFNSIFS